MEEPQLSEEDMAFLGNVFGLERTPEFQASLDALENDAASGDEVARQALEGILVAESTIDEFEADGLQMMVEAIAICKQFLPELVARSQIDPMFMAQFAPMLQAIQRSAYARGWKARERRLG